MLFMGEEWGADTPWQFFTDHTDPDWPARSARAAGPSSPSMAGTRRRSPTRRTRRRSCAPSSTGASPPASRTASLLDWYRTLLALRRSRPELTDPRLDQVRVDYDEDARWLLVTRGPLRIAANLGTAPVRIPLTASRPTAGAPCPPPCSPHPFRE